MAANGNTPPRGPAGGSPGGNQGGDNKNRQPIFSMILIALAGLGAQYDF